MEVLQILKAMAQLMAKVRDPVMLVQVQEELLLEAKVVDLQALMEMGKPVGKVQEVDQRVEDL